MPGERGAQPPHRADLWLGAHDTQARATLAQPVDAIERSRLVTFSQRRVVEHGVDEVINRAAERQDGLPDVNQLAGALADDMNTQERARFGVKDQFQQAGAVAHDLAAGDLAILRLAYLVCNALLGQFFFVAPNRGYFWDGVNTVGKQLGHAVRRNAKRVAGSQTPLLH